MDEEFDVCTTCQPCQTLLRSEVQRGQAVASDSASSCTAAAAEVLGKIEFERAMSAYGAFDTSSGLVVATAGRSASVHAALLAAVERECVRRIIIVEGSSGAKMAWALEAGIKEQREARLEAQADPINAMTMSHAGLTAAENEEWSAAMRIGTVDSAEQGLATADDPMRSEFEAVEPSPRVVAVDTAPLTDIVENIAKGQVHVILAGADSVDPSTGAALLSYGCNDISTLAQAAKERQPAISVIVLCLAWSKDCDAQGRSLLPSDLQSRVVGLPSK